MYNHCINIALLSMSVASSAGLPREQIKEIGFGAVLQDIGMLHVPQEIRLASRKLSKKEFDEVHRHPIHTLNWVEQIGSVSVAAQLICYQSHERADKAGYPRRRTSMYVHPYSKIVAIADSYVAMTHARPYRPALLPFQVTRAILSDVGKFERSTVRMFLDAVGLFPPGSYVELDNGTKCRVVRANPGYHTRPLIVELDANDKPTGGHLDLCEVENVSVARAIPSPQELCGTK
ncbi:MAG: HD domain-containing protein [Planctomycetes bacterium]|nr:HD domain-containing protein [Planctomycetota bacterium]